MKTKFNSYRMLIDEDFLKEILDTYTYTKKEDLYEVNFRQMYARTLIIREEEVGWYSVLPPNSLHGERPNLQLETYWKLFDQFNPTVVGKIPLFYEMHLVSRGTIDGNSLMTEIKKSKSAKNIIENLSEGRKKINKWKIRVMRRPLYSRSQPPAEQITIQTFELHDGGKTGVLGTTGGSVGRGKSVGVVGNFKRFVKTGKGKIRLWNKKAAWEVIEIVKELGENRVDEAKFDYFAGMGPKRKELELQKLRLFGKAMKMFPASPKQKEIDKELEKVWAQIKKTPMNENKWDNYIAAQFTFKSPWADELLDKGNRFNVKWKRDPHKDDLIILYGKKDNILKFVKSEKILRDKPVHVFTTTDGKRWEDAGFLKKGKSLADIGIVEENITERLHFEPRSSQEKAREMRLVRVSAGKPETVVQRGSREELHQWAETQDLQFKFDTSLHGGFYYNEDGDQYIVK